MGRASRCVAKQGFWGSCRQRRASTVAHCDPVTRKGHPLAKRGSQSTNDIRNRSPGPPALACLAAADHVAGCLGRSQARFEYLPVRLPSRAFGVGRMPHGGYLATDAAHAVWQASGSAGYAPRRVSRPVEIFQPPYARARYRVRIHERRKQPSMRDLRTLEGRSSPPRAGGYGWYWDRAGEPRCCARAHRRAGTGRMCRRIARYTHRVGLESAGSADDRSWQK